MGKVPNGTWKRKERGVGQIRKLGLVQESTHIYIYTGGTTFFLETIFIEDWFFFIDFFQFKLILEIFNFQVKGSHRKESSKTFTQIMQNIKKKFLENYLH